MNSEQKQTFERRKSPRVELIGVTGLPDNPGTARIIDISASGAQVEFNSRLVPGNVYEMKLSFADRQIVARVKVTRSIDLHESAETADGAGETRCVAGLEFIGLDPGDGRYLECFVAGLAHTES